MEPAKQITAKLIPPMSEPEKAIEEIFTNEGAEVTMLKDVSGGQAVGTAWRHQGKKFALKMEVSRLASLDKGFSMKVGWWAIPVFSRSADWVRWMALGKYIIKPMKTKASTGA